jgi:site-specific recombinase XerD
MTEPERIPVGEYVTIYRRGKRGTWTADFLVDGVHQRRSLKTTNKKFAVRRAFEIDNRLSSGTYRPPSPATTISAANQQYLDYLRAEGRASKTIVRYQGELKTFDEFCRQRNVHRLAQITPAVLDAYRAERRKTHHPKTLFHETIVFKQLLRWSESRRLIAENPLRHYRVAKPISLPKPAPTLPEVQQILAAATPRRRLLFATLAFTGMRVGDLRRLRQPDVDCGSGWFHVVSRPGAETKTRQSRKIPIHPELLTLLATYKIRKGPLFFSAEPSSKFPEGGHEISDKKLNEDFQHVAAKLGMPIGREAGYTLHCLRRFFETFCINSGVPQRAVDVWMGHRSDKSMGAVYYSLSDAESKAMMAKVPFSLDTKANEVNEVSEMKGSNDA